MAKKKAVKKTKAGRIKAMEKKPDNKQQEDYRFDDNANRPQRMAPEPVRAPEPCGVDGCTAVPPCTKHGPKPE